MAVVSPVKPATGVKVMFPVSSTVYVPSPGCVKVVSRSGVLGSKSTVVTSIVVLGSLSSSVMLKVTGCPATVVLLLSVATGGRFTTSTVMLALSDVLPLLSATV